MSAPLNEQVQPYSKEDARGIFRKACSDGAFISTKHARKRMQEYELDNNDILSLARTGVVFNEPELDIKTNEWTYRIESGSLQLKAVYVITDPNRVRLITIIIHDG
jgi:hypothetical protein